ncbi:MAG: substrate-binding domain-containing protein [Victivallaceae bacterium]|nr:substrate-binding domain-containing protein [Victivallaceae bacterium]
MRTNHIYATVLLLASAVLFSLGVYKKLHPRAENKVFQIAVIPKGTANMWWEVVRKGAERAAQEENCTVSWNGPEVETDREKQIQAVEDALIKRADAVVIGPNDYKALARPIENIAGKSVPCIVIDSPVAAEKYDSFVGTDNYKGGAEAARLLAAAIGGHGQVLVIRFVQNSASTDARDAGFTDTIKKDYPGIEILSAQYTLGTVEDARQKTIDLLERFPQTDAVFAVNHPSSVGAFKGIETQKLDGKIRFVAFDSDPILLDGVARGKVLAIIAQNPFEIGYQGVRQAARKLRGETIERSLPIPSMTVTRDNLEEMKKLYPQALGL